MCNYFKLNTPLVSADINLQHKYTFIKGRSGVGKSLFIKEIERVLDVESNELNVSLPVYVISSSSSLDAVTSLVQQGTALFVCDAYYAYNLLRLVEDYECYIIAMTRKVQTSFAVSCDYKVYEMVRGFDGVSKLVTVIN